MATGFEGLLGLFCLTSVGSLTIRAVTDIESPFPLGASTSDVDPFLCSHNGWLSAAAGAGVGVGAGEGYWSCFAGGVLALMLRTSVSFGE